MFCVAFSSSSHARVKGDGSTNHSLPTPFYVEISSCVSILLFYVKDQSTVVHQAETTVGEHSLTSCT